MSAPLIDLHVHTTASDGIKAPRDVIEAAHAANLSAVAVTDHDTLAGVPEALGAGERLGLYVIPGVELSVEYPSELHILGYHPRPDSPITQALALLRARRAARIDVILENLARAGVRLTRAEVEAVAHGDSVGRGHVAQALVQKGCVNSVSEAFDRYLAIGRPGYAAHKKLGIDEALDLLSSSGATPVWAHPYLTTRDRTEQARLYAHMKARGLAGLECWHPSAAPAEAAALRNLCLRDGLRVTGGSDWHGYADAEPIGWPMRYWQPERDYPRLAEMIAAREPFI